MGAANESHPAFQLLEQARIARSEDRLLEAKQKLNEAVSLCRQSGTQRELVLVLGKLGHVELDLGNHDAARSCYEEAIDICREQGDSLKLAHAVRHLGDVHRHASRSADAEACYDEALAIYRGLGQPPKVELANAIRPLALLNRDFPFGLSLEPLQA